MEEKTAVPIIPQHVWHKDVRRVVALRSTRALAATTVVIVVVIIIILIIFGAMFNTGAYTQNISIVIVDNDQDEFGDFLTTALQSTDTFGFFVDNTVSDPISYISAPGGSTVMAITIPTAFTATLYATLYGNITTYPIQDQTISLVYDQGRNAVLSSFAAIVQQQLQGLTLTYMRTITQNISLANMQDFNVLLSPAPISVTPIHPSSPPSAAASGFINILIMMVSLTFAVVVGTTWHPMQGKITWWQLFIIRNIHAAVNALIIAATMTIIVICFGVSMVYNAGLYFLIVLLFSFTVMTTAFFLVGIPGIGLILLPFFVVLNIASSSALVMPELAHNFYKIGYGLPLFNAVSAIKVILFDTDNRIGLYVGIIVIYLAIFWVGSLVVMMINTFIVPRVKNIVESRIQKKNIDKIASPLEKELSEISPSRSSDSVPIDVQPTVANTTE
jgi:hypothetical protein